MPSLLAKSAQRFNVGASFDRLAFDSLFSAQSALQMATTSLRENGGFQRGSSSLNHIKLWKHIVGIFELAQQRDLDAFGKRIITC